MKALIVGGFLGSGKTTFVNQLAQYLAAGDVKAVILENEIGQTRIDQTFLGAAGLKIQNLSSGCVCCTLSGALSDALALLKKQLHPNWVILEASGVAIPENIRNVFDSLDIPARSCILADAARWQRIQVPLSRLLSDQLRGADVILLNKTESLKPETLEEIMRSVQTFSGNCPVVPVSLLSQLTKEQLRNILGGKQ